MLPSTSLLPLACRRAFAAAASAAASFSPVRPRGRCTPTSLPLLACACIASLPSSFLTGGDRGACATAPPLLSLPRHDVVSALSSSVVSEEPRAPCPFQEPMVCNQCTAGTATSGLPVAVAPATERHSDKSCWVADETRAVSLRPARGGTSGWGQSLGVGWALLLTSVEQK